MKQINEIADPLGAYKVARSRSASGPEVRIATRTLGEELAERSLELVLARGSSADRVLCVVILRGGMMLYPGFSRVFDGADFCLIGIERDITTSVPRHRYHTSIPGQDYQSAVYIDCVCATGNTVAEARRVILRQSQPEHEVVCVLSGTDVATETLASSGLDVIGFSLYEKLDGNLVIPDLGERDAGDLFTSAEQSRSAV